MNRDDALELFEKARAIIENSHIVYTSGRHGTKYMDKDMVYPHVLSTANLCREIAVNFNHRSIDAVVAAEKGGIILSQWVAYYLSTRGTFEVLAFYAEKEVTAIPDPENKGRKCYAETGNFIFKRGGAKELLPGKRVLVVEDVLNTGGTVRKVIEAARNMGCIVVGVGALCNRGGVTKEIVGNPPELISVIDLNMESWSQEDCLRSGPCSRDVPINTSVGKGADFLVRQQMKK